MTPPYRLIVWGPGSVGGATLRHALQSDQFEIVGVKVFSEAKEGVDAGELVGAAPIGVAATTDTDALVALDADCVIHTPQAFDADGMDADVMRLLRSGKNVVSTAGYHFPEMTKALRLGTDGAEYPARLLEACQAGGSTLMGAGIHPNFVFSSLVLPLTGCMTDLRELKIHESLDLHRLLGAMGGADNQLVAALGFGVPLEVLDVHSPPAIMLDVYYDELAGYLGQRLFGVAPSEIRVEHELTGTLADRDHSFDSIPGLTISAGTTISVLRTQRGYIDDQLFFTNEDCWYIGEENRHFGTANVDSAAYSNTLNYIVEAHGEPDTVRLQFALDEEADRDPVVTRVSVATLLQSVPHACAAAPGFLSRGDVVPHFMRSLFPAHTRPASIA